MARQKNKIIAVLDIGSTKVACFIAKLNMRTELEVIGIGHNASGGIRAGNITDVKALEMSIIQAVDAAETMAGERIQSVYVTLPSNYLLSKIVTSDIVVTGHEINTRDINKLSSQIIDKYAQRNQEVIQDFDFDYMLDGNRGIESPLGMYGDKLTGYFHVLAVPANSLKNLSACLARCQLDVEMYLSASYASGLACLSDDEMELGVTLIEFGGGCTSVSVFKHGNIIYTDAVPIGGINITNDIAIGLSTDFANAERLKTLYGTVILPSTAKSEKIEVPISDDEDGEINLVERSLLVDIIRARAEEIIEIIQKKVESKNFNEVAGNKIVITGGTSQLEGIKELIAHMFSKTVRVGYPKTVSGLADSTSGVGFCVPVGMLWHFFEMDNALSEVGGNSAWSVREMMEWIKHTFGITNE